MVYRYFDSGVTTLENKSTNNDIKQNLQLAEELHKPIIKNFKKRTVYSGFKDNIQGTNLADMQSINKLNKGTRSLLCVVDIFSKHAWVISSKEKKCVNIANTFQKYKIIQ